MWLVGPAGNNALKSPAFVKDLAFDLDGKGVKLDSLRINILPPSLVRPVLPRPPGPAAPAIPLILF